MANNKHIVNISARSLAEFVLKSGSIDSRFSGFDRAAEGSRLHRLLQKQGGKNYTAEKSLSIDIEHEGIVYHLAGRADGIITEDGKITIDEIKTVVKPLEAIQEAENPSHWGQAVCYAHIVCVQQNLEKISLRLTYCNADTGEVRRFFRVQTASEVKAQVMMLIKAYHKWALLGIQWQEKRNISLRELSFPFDEYRGGQRPLAIASYNTIKNEGRVFCCAPTGIGKTISTMFPAMKAMGESYGERIFYLTAKTITRQAAENTIELLKKTAKTTFNFNSITLTAKDKICFLTKRACRPEICQYAKGFYDKINDVVYEALLNKQTFSREVIEEIALKHEVCPYELSLDISIWCDCVICDYNYLFDPTARLKRFFEGGKSDSIFLIDEAHNLVDRSRTMYSAELKKTDYYDLKKELPKQFKNMHKALNAINAVFIELRHISEDKRESAFTQKEQPISFKKPIEQFIVAAKEFLEANRASEFEDDLLALYFNTLFYQTISEGYSDAYVSLISAYKSEVQMKLLCLNPALQLEECLSAGRAAVFFSATLQPLPYYKETLGGGENAKLLQLESPFTQKHLGLFVVDDISTKFNERDNSLIDVVNAIATMVKAKNGNYMAYFPSYSYMQQVYDAFEKAYSNIDLILQERGMEEQSREDFITRFENNNEEHSSQQAYGVSRSIAGNKKLLGFCVLGGIFAEGIDFKGDMLIGTAIIGVGLPQFSAEPKALCEYYNEQNGCGFEYAYQFPGMNKVMQAAGRVIRTEEDRGVVLLIDSRFSSARYIDMYPPHWGHYKRTALAHLPSLLQKFWQGNT